MKLGLLGFSGDSIKSRTDNLGIYRAESNRHIQDFNGKIRLYQFYGQFQTLTHISSTTVQSITGLTFKPDGTYVYVLADATNTVYQYTLSTPWDITTGSSLTASRELDSYLRSRTGNSYSLTGPTGITFSSDGTKMHITDTWDRKIVQFSLSNPWMVDSATFTNTTVDNDRPLWYLTSTNSVTDICFSHDGASLFTLNTNTSEVMVVSRYSLNSGATPFDIGTKGTPNYTYAEGINISSFDSSMRGISFNSNGTKLYTCGLTDARTYEFNLTTPFLFSPGVNFDVKDIFYDGFIAGREGAPQAIYMNVTGNNSDFYVIGSSNAFSGRVNIIYQYKLVQK